MWHGCGAQGAFARHHCDVRPGFIFSELPLPAAAVWPGQCRGLVGALQAVLCLSLPWLTCSPPRARCSEGSVSRSVACCQCYACSCCGHAE